MRVASGASNPDVTPSAWVEAEPLEGPVGKRLVEGFGPGLGQKIHPDDAGVFEEAVDQLSSDAPATMGRRDDEEGQVEVDRTVAEAERAPHDIGAVEATERCRGGAGQHAQRPVGIGRQTRPPL